jgi:antirestriction protein
MCKQIFSRYNIGSIMSVIFQKDCGVMLGTLLKLYVNIPTHHNLLQFKRPCTVSRDMQSKSQYLGITL